MMADVASNLPTDEQLISWHGERLSGQDLARREGVPTKWLYRQWARLRREGVLARGGRSGSESGGSSTAPAGNDYDGRPRVGDDLLLARLYQVHVEPRMDLVDVKMAGGRKGRGRGDGARSSAEPVRS